MRALYNGFQHKGLKWVNCPFLLCEKVFLIKKIDAALWKHLLIWSAFVCRRLSTINESTVPFLVLILVLCSYSCSVCVFCTPILVLCSYSFLVCVLCFYCCSVRALCSYSCSVFLFWFLFLFCALIHVLCTYSCFVLLFLSYVCGVTERTCGGLIDSEQGFIQSPNWPGLYPTNVECTWKITPEKGRRILVVIPDIYLESKDKCKDFLVMRKSGS